MAVRPAVAGHEVGRRRPARRPRPARAPGSNRVHHPARGRGPPLPSRPVLHNQRDPQTPLPGGRAMHRALHGSRLVYVRGVGLDRRLAAATPSTASPAAPPASPAPSTPASRTGACRTTRSPTGFERVRALTGGAAVDVVFDGVGGEIGTGAASLVEAGGRFVPTGAAGGVYTDAAALAARGVTVLGLQQVMERGLNLRESAVTVLEEAAAGRLRPVIGRTFPLERAADAHAAMEARTTIGKTLLLV
ncbi:zinc-binding dehydrogenase [Streptomyces capitiformicae]|uniref:zinc-binding dehydrogenase n=1 Tax=Streptomyces capitiformicae TaxID=2014920 RepID=UPI0016782038